MTVSSAGATPPGSSGPRSGPLLGGHGVADVVLPLAVDLEEAHGHPLVPELQLLDHPAAGRIAGDDGHLDPMEAQGLEGELEDHHHGLGNQAGPGHLLVDPVADGAVLERSPLDGREGDLPDEPPLHEDPEAEATAQLPLPLPHAAAGREAGGILGRLWAPPSTAAPRAPASHGTASGRPTRPRSLPLPGWPDGPAIRVARAIEPPEPRRLGLFISSTPPPGLVDPSPRRHRARAVGEGAPTFPPQSTHATRRGHPRMVGHRPPGYASPERRPRPGRPCAASLYSPGRWSGRFELASSGRKQHR